MTGILMTGVLMTGILVTGVLVSCGCTLDETCATPPGGTS